MSLDFYTDTIADQSFVRDEEGRFQKKLETVVWAMYAVGQQKVTDKNHREVFHRIAMWYFANDSMPPVGPKDIENLIGLSTNVSHTTNRQFELKVAKRVRERAIEAGKSWDR